MWFKINNQEVKLFIYVKPNAKNTKIIGVKESALHIALHAKAKEGEANRELIQYLARQFHLPKKNIILQNGEHSRYKQVIIPLNEDVKLFIKNVRDHSINPNANNP